MKKLELNQMQNLIGGQKQPLKDANQYDATAGGGSYINPSAGCIFGLLGIGFGVVAVLSGAGAPAGIPLLLGIGGTLPECFPAKPK
jgi:hypothetical protein